MSKKTDLKLSSKPPSDLEGTQCKDCLRKEAVEDRFKCLIFNNFYFDDEKPASSCWAYNADASVEMNTLQQAKNYINNKTDEVKRDYLSISIDGRLEELKRIASKQFKEDLKGIYLGEVHRSKSGGGDRQDRTHKLFPKARMKDNRYKSPWGEDD